MRHILAFAALASLASLGCQTAGEPTPSVAALKGGCRMECPKCKPGEVCPMIACRLVCPPGVTPCGENVCAKDETCCAPECGACVKVDPALGCPAIKCAPTGCTSDADCTLFDDYCTGCDCRALLVTDPAPVCDGPGVKCFAQPCGGKAAACDRKTGQCVVTEAPKQEPCGSKVCPVGQVCCNPLMSICTLPGEFCIM